jgi:hypothetical protein
VKPWTSSDFVNGLSIDDKKVNVKCHLGMPNPFTTLGSDPDDQPEEKTTVFPISDEERTLLVKSEAFVYKIPPQVPNRILNCSFSAPY